MKEPKFAELSNGLMQYTAGNFVYTIEGETVLVTKNTKTGIETVNLYTYKNDELAELAAYKMAKRQANV